jgi:hypothetical protein
VAGPQGPQGSGGTGPQGAPGPQGSSLFIIAATAPSTSTTPVGTAWWDTDNGRTFLLYDDGNSKQWVEFIGSQGPSGAQGAAGAQGAQGAASSVAGPQGPQGAAGAGGTQGAQGAQGAAGAQGSQGVPGPVGGTNTQVIYNDAGAPAGDPTHTFNKTTKALTAQLLVPGQIQASAVGLGAQSGNLTVDWNAGMMQAIQVVGNLNISFANFAIYGPMLKLYLYSTAGGTVTFPAAVVWPGGIQPSFTTGPRKEAIIAFLSWGGTSGGVWFANVAVY